MKIAVWKTGHEIADTVADALRDGLKNADIFHPNAGYKSADAHIGYGILRGVETVFRRSAKENVPCFLLDRGYFKPGHYDGHYRISLHGTQQTIGLDKLQPDYERLDGLGVEFPEPYRINSKAHTLYIPPTQHVRRFFGIGDWKAPKFDTPHIVRGKDDATPLEEHLTNCLRVVTFNSSIGWEALRRGIPVYSDANHSIIGAYQKLIKTDDRPLHLDIKARRELFAIMSGLQLTLEEIRAGKICKVMDTLLSLSTSGSGGIPEKPLPVM